jgi:hypothetical protein
VSGLKLFRTDTTRSMTEIMPRLAEIEADVQGLVEADMETRLGVRFLASEYSTGPVHGGRIDSLGLDATVRRSSSSTSGVSTLASSLN